LQICDLFQAYLEDHLSDPAAPDLLDHLFPPLAYLVDECYDLFDEDLVRDVLSPLLTNAACGFLDQHLGQKQRVIWKALGDCWIKPRRVQTRTE
jgi:hypothetical protein